jgi:CSLREA domain-containing protein
MNSYILRLIRLLFALALMIILVLPITAVDAYDSTWVVNTVDDVDDGICGAIHCSLREAINIANATSGQQTIAFDIPGSTPHIIELCSPLPTITNEVIVDGTLEPDYSSGSGPVVAIAAGKETGCAAPAYGLWIEGGGSIVRGLSIVGFDSSNDPLSAGIVVYASSGVLVEHNYLGLLPDGTPRGNYSGVLLGSSTNRVHSNVISGNTFGVNVALGSNQINANRIGTDPDGSSTSPSLRNTVGVYIQETAPDNHIGTNGGGNLISGNGTGIYTASSGNFIFGNQIGTDQSGMDALGNEVGINAADAPYTVVGGAETWTRNLISGNTIGVGVGNHSMIWGNYIGTDINGAGALPNQVGISIQSAIDVHIGGTASGQGNLISGNSIAGIVLHEGATDVEVFANRIGTNLSGFGPIANGRGINVEGSGNFVGDELGGGNIIAYNWNEGVLLLGSAKDNLIAHNAIHDNGTGIYIAHNTAFRDSFTMNLFHDNGALAIDLLPPGPNVNDPGDADGGANKRLNYPEFTAIDTTHVEGTACPGCTVEVYLSTFDPSGYGEGEILLGVKTADSAGYFDFHFPTALTICDDITATATDASGNTSEFSHNASAGICFHIGFLGFAGLAGFEGAIVAISLMLGRRLGVAAGMSSGRAALAGLAAGVMLGAGVFGAVRALPNFVWGSPPGETREATDILPPCEAYLTPGSVHPVEGARASFDIAGNDWMPPDPLDMEGEGEMPPDPLDLEGEGEMPPDPLDLEGEGEMPPDPLDTEGEGEMPPDPLDLEGEGEMPPDPLDNLSLSWIALESLFDDGEHGDGLAGTQWRVELLLPSGEILSQVTAEDAVALSSFGIGSKWLMDDGEHGDSAGRTVMDDGEHGDSAGKEVMDDGEHGDGMTGQPFFWRLTGEMPAEDGSMQAFCQTTAWTSFQLGGFENSPPLPWGPAAPPVPPEEPEEEVQEPEPEPEVCMPTVTALMNLTCRSGPDSAYEDQGYLLEGESATVEGQNLEGTWWWILNPDWQGHCWVWSGGVEAVCIPEDLRVIIPPPLPPTLVCESSLNEADCVAAGGTYVDATQTRAPMCVCP